MRAPEPIRHLYAGLAGIPMETLTKAWWWEQCGGRPRQRSRAEMEAHRRRCGTGGNCFDLALWLLELAREAGLPAYAVGHGFQTEEAHAAVVVQDAGGAEYLCDPGDLWLQPVLVTPEAPGFATGFHPGFFPAAAVSIERTGRHLLVRYRRPNGKVGAQQYDLTPVGKADFLDACHHSQNLLRHSLVEQLLPYPKTGEVGHWEYDTGRSFWSLETGLIEEPPCDSVEGWALRITERTGIAPEISRAALRIYGGL